MEFLGPMIDLFLVSSWSWNTLSTADSLGQVSLTGCLIPASILFVLLVICTCQVLNDYCGFG